MMKKLLQEYENKQPEIVFHWKDRETEAEGWTVINSLRGGAAGGGTRMRKGLDKNEVLSLAKTMEIKFSVCGPPIGGAKSGINFDPADPRKQGVLKRWFQAVSPLLKNYYGTGGDMNVDQRTEVIPITQAYGVTHPQEGVFQGHFNTDEHEKNIRINQLKQGVSKQVDTSIFLPNAEQSYTVGDLITGYGVAEAVKHYYGIYGGALAGKKAIVQGFGNVGGAAAFYLAAMGVKIVGIIDRTGGIIEPEGISFERLKELYATREGNALKAEDMLSFEAVNEQIWNVGAQIFAPCAASRLVTQKQVEQMIAGGLEVITSGANVPFADEAIFFGPIMEYTDKHVSIIPDFISNCGMARVFAYLMQPEAKIEDEAIFNDVSHTIEQALQDVYSKNNNPIHLSQTAFEIALEKLI
jgi:glutamate dehydrogenase/leucine dehydrogenase